MNKPIKIAIISADYPDIISGIGDYSAILFKEFRKHTFQTYLITTKHELISNNIDTLNVNWDYNGLINIYSFIKRNNIKLVIIQYPGILYGKYNLFIHFLCFYLRIKGLKVITTLHEFSNVNFLRRVSELIFLFFSQKTIITNKYELKNTLMYFIPQKSIEIIPIFPNIIIEKCLSDKESNSVLYFGMIYNNKKLDKVLETMNVIDKIYPHRFNFRFVSGVHMNQKSYFNNIYEDANKSLTKSDWYINLPSDEIVTHLENTFIAVLFFNDGLSVRRGSALALIAAGVPLITNKGKYSSDFSDLEDKGVFYYSNDIELKIKLDKLKEDTEFYSNCCKNLQLFSKRFSIKNSVDEYISVIQKIL